VGKNVLMVFAHCDDELVCGWPILQNLKINKTLILASSDRYNNERSWCRHRKFVTEDLCRDLNIKVKILDYSSNFYKINHRDGGLIDFENAVLREISGVSFDYIFTHNPHGEYGHLDHVFLSNLIFKAVDAPLIFSDITLAADWTAQNPKSKRYDKIFFHDKIETVALDGRFYERTVQFYESRGVWTWNQRPNESASLYQV